MAPFSFPHRVEDSECQPTPMHFALDCKTPSTKEYSFNVKTDIFSMVLCRFYVDLIFVTY